MDLCVGTVDQALMSSVLMCLCLAHISLFLAILSLLCCSR